VPLSWFASSLFQAVPLVGQPACPADADAECSERSELAHHGLSYVPTPRDSRSAGRTALPLFAAGKGRVFRARFAVSKNRPPRGKPFGSILDTTVALSVQEKFADSCPPAGLALKLLALASQGISTSSKEERGILAKRKTSSRKRSAAPPLDRRRLRQRLEQARQAHAAREERMDECEKYIRCWQIPPETLFGEWLEWCVATEIDPTKRLDYLRRPLKNRLKELIGERVESWDGGTGVRDWGQIFTRRDWGQIFTREWQ